MAHRCDVCRRYRVKSLKSAAKVNSQLPAFRAELSNPFIVIGVDFVGPVYHKIGKAEIAPLTCASTRAVHLKVCGDLTGQEFPEGIKRVHCSKRAATSHDK